MKKAVGLFTALIITLSALPAWAVEFLVNERNASTIYTWDPDTTTETVYHTVEANDADINFPEGSTEGWFVEHFNDDFGSFTPGSGSGSDATYDTDYAYPKHVTVFNNALFIMHRNNATIYKYDFDGNLITSLTTGNNTGQGMATDGNLLYASFWNGSNSYFETFDEDLNPVGDYTNPTGMPVGDVNIVDFAYDPADATFYGLSTDDEGGTGTESSTVVQFTMGGSVSRTLTLSFSSDGIGQYVTDAVAESGTARFRVTKVFTDLREDEVEVTLTCNSGVPLQQSFTIAGGDPDGVTFVVTNIPDSGADCDVTESGGPDGYSAVLNDGDGCSWASVTGGLYTCEIVNEPGPAEYTVSLDWIVPDAGAEEPTYDVDVTITCLSDILSLDGSDLLVPTDELLVTLGDGDSAVVTVDTTDGSTECSASQSVTQSGVEAQGSPGCSSADLSAGGSASCSFTNTVFFEGIPTLSQYGMAIMVLLMLGVGFVGFRRFV
jgi:hypothetical protein